MEGDNIEQKQGARPQRRNSSESRSYSMSRSSSSSEKKSKGQSKANLPNDVERDANGRLVRYKYCCKICKHPDRMKKACVCVVPLSQRRTDLGGGCRNCGCLGCSKEDYISKGEDPEFHPEDYQETVRNNNLKQVHRKQERRSDFKRDDSMNRKKHRNSPKRYKNSRSRSRSPPQYIDPATMKFYNFDRSLIGSMITNEYHINPILLGFGVPQRTHSYVFGKPR